MKQGVQANIVPKSSKIGDNKFTSSNSPRFVEGHDLDLGKNFKVVAAFDENSSRGGLREGAEGGDRGGED